MASSASATRATTPDPSARTANTVITPVKASNTIVSAADVAKTEEKEVTVELTNDTDLLFNDMPEAKDPSYDDDHREAAVPPVEITPDFEMTDEEAQPNGKKRKHVEGDDDRVLEQQPEPHEMVELEDILEDDVQRQPAAKKTMTVKGVAKPIALRKLSSLLVKKGKSADLFKAFATKHELKQNLSIKSTDLQMKQKVRIGADLPAYHDPYSKRELNEDYTNMANIQNEDKSPKYKGETWPDEKDPKIKWKTIPKSNKYMKHKSSGINIENFLLHPYDHPDIELVTWEKDATFWLARVEDITWEENRARYKVMWKAAQEERNQQAKEDRARERRLEKARLQARDYEPAKNTHEATWLRKDREGTLEEDTTKANKFLSKKGRARITKSKRTKRQQLSQELVDDSE